MSDLNALVGRKDPECWTAIAGQRRIYIIKDESRWIMHVGSLAKKRRTDFATPYLGHAKRAAAEWYGIPLDSWIRHAVVSM